MMRRNTSREDAEYFDISLAKWVIGVLGMLIAVVGKESLLGLILGQTRSDIGGFVRDEERVVHFPRESWFKQN